MAQLCEVAARRPGPDGRHRADNVSAHQRQQGPASVRPARRAGQLARRGRAGQTRCAAAGEGDAEARHRDDDQEPARPARCSSTGARTTARRRRSRRIRFADAKHPTVAAPRTWDEIADPKLRHLRFDEVLERVAKDGDLLGRPRRSVPIADQLTTYRSMRDAAKTPEPVPKSKRHRRATTTLFVIQEHHARRLHYDLRLERDGVLVSWAVPKNLPDTPVGQSPRRAHRGPSAGVPDLRGHHPEGRVRRRAR